MTATPLSSAAIIRFLLAHGVLPPSAVVDGHVSVVASRRDRFALHEVHHGDAVVCTVKMALHDNARPYLAAEGVVLDYLQRHPCLGGIAPKCRARDPEGFLVAMEHIARPASRACPDLRVHAPASADALGSLHRNTVHAQLGVTSTLPPIFGAVCLGQTTNPRALRRLWTLSSDARSLLNGVQTTAREWQRHSLIHTDVKREHWLLRAPADTRELCLIDWELVRAGDPAWDVGSVVHDYLREAAHAATGDPARIRVPRDGRAFLRRYLTVAGEHVWNHGFHQRIAFSVGTRSVQTALETLATGSEWGVQEVLRTAEVIFRDPDTFAQDIIQAAGAPHAA